MEVITRYMIKVRLGTEVLSSFRLVEGRGFVQLTPIIVERTTTIIEF